MTSSPSDFWYDIVTGDTLRQGDLFCGLVVRWFSQDLEPPISNPSSQLLTTDFTRETWIIMSASCDVDRDANVYPNVLLGRVLTATAKEFKAAPDEFDKRLEVIRKGLEPSKFLLPEHDGIQPPFSRSVVHFQSHVTMPMNYLKKACIAPRLRLRHPFRESFGNWVGANFARVGPETHMLVPPITRTWPIDTLRAAEAAEGGAP